jgi:pterin-4a-carbinolamine dehydratase
MPRPTPLDPHELQTALENLPDWDIVETPPPDSQHTRQELHRLFEFSSFPDAMHFMLTASRFIHVTDHHPSWRNTYAKVEVWITTGELKQRLSAKDITLADYLETLFRKYAIHPVLG